LSTPDPPEIASPDPAEPPGEQAPKKRRNPWIWICGVLVLVAAGLLIWALTIRSDLDSTQQDLATANEELDSTQQQLDSKQQELDGKQEELDSANQELDSANPEAEAEPSEDDERDGRGRLVIAGKALYDRFAEQLDATNEQLAATQQELEDSQQAATDAEKQAAAAKEKAAAAGNDADKAAAEAEQARAETEAAEARAAVAADCARAYIAAFGGLFEGDSVSEQAAEVREQLEDITAACKDELGGD
jgi:chromosome segregation ATPase